MLISFNNISTLYVSQTSGNDNYNGFFAKFERESDGPFLTLEKAISTVSGMRKSGYVQPVSIKIVDKVYNVSKPVSAAAKTASDNCRPGSAEYRYCHLQSE